MMPATLAGVAAVTAAVAFLIDSLAWILVMASYRSGTIFQMWHKMDRKTIPTWNKLICHQLSGRVVKGEVKYSHTLTLVSEEPEFTSRCNLS